VIHKGRVYVLDYLEEKSADALRCFSLLDGTELWRRSYRLDIKRNHGYSRTVPAVNDDYAVSMGPMGHLMCLDAKSGKLLWTKDIINEFKAIVPQWYSGQCPFIDGDTVIVAPGGEKALLAGFDLATGNILWQTPNPGGWKMSHSSVVPMQLNEQKMYVYAAVGGIAGIAAEGENVGELLWQSGDWGATVVAPSPVILNDGFIFQSAGYGAGSIVLKINKNSKGYSAAVVHRFDPKEALATEQQSAIFYNNLLFGILTKDAGSKRMRLVACEPKNPSEFVFSGNSRLRFGLGPMISANNKFFALADDGNLSLLTFDNHEFKQVSQAQVLPGVDAWGPLAVADGIMLLRDSTSMACIDLTHDARWARRQSKDADQ
jgi:outer membrane protein assembly factor BamB